MSERRTVYVFLPDEAVDVWRPVEADCLGPDEYRLIGPVPEEEVWEFKPGDAVRCREHVFYSGVRGLVAFALVPSATKDSEPS